MPIRTPHDREPKSNSGLEAPTVGLNDERTGLVLRTLLAEHPEVERLINTPQRILAFRAFAFIRVRVLLKEYAGAGDLAAWRDDQGWTRAILKDSERHAAILAAVQAVADEITFDLTLADRDPLGPDSSARLRFRQFAALETRARRTG